MRRQRTSTGDALPDSLHPVLRRVYGARGVRSPDDLDLGLERLLPVGSLGGVPAAVDLLLRCHRDGRRVLVLGDFDADGATSTALMIRQLRRLGFADPQFLVPDRFRFGYGLTPEIVRVAAHDAARADRHGGQRRVVASRASPRRDASASTCWSPTITCRVRRCPRRPRS